MKKFLFLALLLVAAFTTVTLSAAANNPPEPSGERITLFTSDTTYPAGEPFHIRHGWRLTFAELSPGFDFELEVDGVFMNEQFRTKSINPDAMPPDVTIFWVHNFPEGLSGSHTFTGHWFTPCQQAVAEGDYPGPCPDPEAPVETQTQTLTLDFVD